MSATQTSAGLGGRISGVVIGLVVDVVDPDAIGRVRISLPWYDPDYETWARVSQIYAGDKFGSTWIPEVGTEVLVAFDHGDMRWPYVLGCLYSNVDVPPVSRTQSDDVKTLRTPAGSELSFDEGKGIIDLKTPAGASIRLDERGGAITLKSAQKIELDAPQITITASAKVTISGASVAIN
jgi:uncharacterized protein involved in type VI secretion and phage assembly